MRDVEKKNRANRDYYYRHRERLKEKQKLRSREEYLDEEKRQYKNQKQIENRNKNPAQAIFYRIKQRASRMGLAFNLSVEDFIIPTKCPVLGIPLVFGSLNKDECPSVDRIDNTKGYTKDNIHIISLRANRLKSNATIPELKMLSDYFQTLTLS